MCNYQTLQHDMYFKDMARVRHCFANIVLGTHTHAVIHSYIHRSRPGAAAWVADEQPPVQAARGRVRLRHPGRGDHVQPRRGVLPYRRFAARQSRMFFFLPAKAGSTAAWAVLPGLANATLPLCVNRLTQATNILSQCSPCPIAEPGSDGQVLVAAPGAPHVRCASRHLY
jgi:hypothetical protein